MKGNSSPSPPRPSEYFLLQSLSTLACINTHHTFTHASVPLSSCCIADGSDLAKSQAVRCALCSPPDMQLSNYRPGKTFTPSTAGPVSAKTKCSKWESPSVLFLFNIYSAPGNPLTHLASLQCTAETGSRNLAWRNLLTSITMWRVAWLVFDQINRQRTSQDNPCKN